MHAIIKHLWGCKKDHASRVAGVCPACAARQERERVSFLRACARPSAQRTGEREPFDATGYTGEAAPYGNGSEDQ